MTNICTKRALAASAAVTLLLLSPASLVRAQAGVERKVLLQEDLTIPAGGYQVTLIGVTIAAGAREGQHTHPGTLVGQVQEGELMLEKQGLPTQIYKAGESFSVKPGQIHEGMNHGQTPIKILVTVVAEKGKPLTTQVK
jgi:quercetin dioxygenase-like cupin family protein